MLVRRLPPAHAPEAASISPGARAVAAALARAAAAALDAGEVVQGWKLLEDALRGIDGRPVLPVQVSAERPPDAADGGVAEGVAVSSAEKEKARRLGGFGPPSSVSAEGIETAASGAQTRSGALTGAALGAQERPGKRAPGGSSPAYAPPCPPDTRVEALRGTALALADGDRTRAGELLEAARRALGAPPALRLVERRVRS